MNKKLYKALSVIGLMIMFVVPLAFAPASSDIPATPSDLDPATGSITLTKQLVGDIWHIRCDYMDGTTFRAGGGFWKRDLISNPEGVLSQEGHRSNKCGNDDNWVIWVGTDGSPYRMDEIKSGSTGGTLPTVIYKPRYNLTDDEIRNMSVDDIDLIWRYSQNFIDVMDWSEIQIGRRMYWTTQNGSQVWYHTGVPYKSSPTFMLFVDDVGYPLIAGGSVEINDLLPGIHEITESADAKYYLGEVTSSGNASQNGWTVTIDVGEDQNVYVNWPNVVKTPKPTTSPKIPDPPVVITPTPEPTPEPTETPTPSPTPTPTPTPEPTDVPTESPTLTPTEEPTITPTVPPTATPTNTPTRTPAPTSTVDITEPPTETPIVTETPTPEPTTTPTHTPKPVRTPEPIVDMPIPEIPEGYKQPRTPRGIWTPLDTIEDYITSLGIELIINHVGDAFD